MLMYFPTVMIVEDDELTSIYLEKRLISYGFTSIYKFKNGREALACFCSQKIDVVIMDVEIEGDWDGIETASKFREIRSCFIIFLSAHYDDDILKRVVKTEPLGYLLKPLYDESLRVVLNLATHTLSYQSEIDKKDRWFVAILNHLTVAVIGIDLNGHIIFINPMAEKHLGYQFDDVMGKSLLDLVNLYDEDGRSFVINPIQKALENGVAQYANNVTILTKTLTKKDVSFSISIIFDENKQKIGAVVSIK